MFNMVSAVIGLNRLFILACFLVITGCEAAYFNTMESFGVHKRNILVDRVEDARDSQQDAQEEFRSALEQFKAMVDFDGGDLEKEYARLNNAYEGSVDAADEIRERINGIESVAEALFDEWETELDDYSDAGLRRESQQSLRSTKQRYAQLLTAMHKAEERMNPVLETMQDQVLYLKHNLNARAIQSLKGEVIAIDRNVDNLLAAMEQSIAEADKFIRDMQSS